MGIDPDMKSLVIDELNGMCAKDKLAGVSKVIHGPEDRFVACTRAGMIEGLLRLSEGGQLDIVLRDRVFSIQISEFLSKPN